MRKHIKYKIKGPQIVLEASFVLPQASVAVEGSSVLPSGSLGGRGGALSKLGAPVLFEE